MTMQQYGTRVEKLPDEEYIRRLYDFHAVERNGAKRNLAVL